MAGERVVVALDIGTTKVCTLIGELRGDHQVQVVGVGTCPSRGLRKGVVVDMEEAVGAIATSLRKAEVYSGYRIIGAFVAVSGGHLDSELVHAGVSLSRERPVSKEDLSMLMEAARLEDVPAGRQMLHVIPRGYVVDGENGIRNPVGMLVSRLEVEGLVVSSGVAPLQNLRRCVERTGIQVDGFVSAGLASAHGVLSEPEMQLGVVLMDIGGGTTDLVWYRDGEARFVGAIPLGGYHVTNDLSVGLGMPYSAAEEVKLRFACAVPFSVAEDETMDASSLADDQTRQVSRRFVSEIVAARLSEIFEMASEELRERGFDGVLPAGLVLTGGAAQLRGIRELAQQSFDMPTRIGHPDGLSGAVDSISTPAYATGAGLLKWIPAESGRIGGGTRPQRRRAGLGAKLRSLLGAFLP